MSLTSEGLTVEKVKTQIAGIEEETRKRLRHLRALLRCLEDEREGQKELPFSKDAEPAAKTTKAK